MVNSGWEKLSKYYKLTDQSPVYIAALVLNPNFKWRYIQENWTKEWIPAAKEKMRQFWDSYKPQGTFLTPMNTATSPRRL